MSSETLKLAINLIEKPSITPDDCGCQEILIQRLERIGFDCETLIFDDVTNLWARRGSNGPVLAFAGHTDVVHSATFSPNGQMIVTASWDRTARLWDVETEQQIRLLDHTDEVNSAAFSPNGTMIVSVSSICSSVVMNHVPACNVAWWELLDPCSLF